MKKMFLKLRGKWRLTGGYCPKCYSSPPQPDCTICDGSYKYGHTLSAQDRRRLWQAYCAELDGKTP